MYWAIFGHVHQIKPLAVAALCCTRHPGPPPVHGNVTALFAELVKSDAHIKRAESKPADLAANRVQLVSRDDVGAFDPH